MGVPLLRGSSNERRAQVEAPATNSAPKPTKVPSMPDYVPSTEPVNHVESGRKRDFVSNRSLARSGKYRPGSLPHQKLSVRMPKVGKVPPIVRVRTTAAAMSVAINVPPSTPPILPARQLLQLPYLPSRLECRDHRCSDMFDASMYSTTLPVLQA